MLRSLVQLVREFWLNTVATYNATGSTAPTQNVSDSEILTIPTSGDEVAMPDIDEIARTRALLDEAIQNHMSALYETPL